MKLAPFFAISAALHAVGFFYPVRLTPHAREEFIPVTVVGFDQFGGASGGAGAVKPIENPKATVRAAEKKIGAMSASPRGAARVAKAEEQAVSTGLQPVREATQPIAAQISEVEQQPAPPENPSASHEVGRNGAKIAFASLAGAGGADPAGDRLGGGQGQGSSGAGQGNGAGSGGFSQGDSRFTQVRYRETPKPLYPERARKEGQQGRVLLRVLVDQEGRSKSVEVSRSSGSETLDRAAAEAIKLWRFLPARYGDKPVESWVRIPVDFRLTDAGDQ
jgi:protein TonB